MNQEQQLAALVHAFTRALIFTPFVYRVLSLWFFRRWHIDNNRAFLDKHFGRRADNLEIAADHWRFQRFLWTAMLVVMVVLVFNL
jgi:hypothetical protein